LLKHDYLKFQSNFDNYSAPYLLKTDEALYYEGRSGSSLDASSAIVFKDAIQVFAQQREIQGIEYATARANTALKYNFGPASKCETYFKKLER